MFICFPGSSRKSAVIHAREILLVCALAGWLVIPWMGALWFARRTTGIAALHTDPVLAWNAFDE
jgi:hypothetical protein